MYKYLIKPVLFSLPPEKAHHFSVSVIKKLFKIGFVRNYVKSTHFVTSPSLERKLFGLTFPNPVGLAAGFDKNADFYNEFANFGFGFIEIGTVTPKPQPGNPQPRLFRLPKDKALINRMGFNNDGVKKAVENLKKRKTNIIIGGNIGKNKVTPNENAVDDYITCFNELFPYVDYFVVNVSSPNTPNLRELQDKKPLTNILNRLQQENTKKEVRKPILLKIAPDLSFEQLDDIIDIVAETKIDGIIATNTTIQRSGLKTPKDEIEKIGNGGLSGRPLLKRSTEVIQYLKQKSQNAFTVIGVGGITKPEDALEKINAGADLVQVYTGFVYEGPALIKKINKLLLENFEQNENN
ncbi:MAG TPA: dihydroorotate dehydrogenase (quinone) [Flavobacteriales bacterium]|nr:dihydroorotate dehydrogenase (quinone) [Flavobacteriales bacterium]|tara:strand:- start:63887 stop:64939 length:1053 start_codon:yes stop_codon:yes gene_type:complete